MNESEQIIFSNLERIYNAKNQHVLKSEIIESSKITEYNYKSVFNYLIENDLIENEIGFENNFYLTEKGFQIIENGFYCDKLFESDDELIHPEDAEIVLSKIKKRDEKQRRQYLFAALFIIGLIGTYYIISS